MAEQEERSGKIGQLNGKWSILFRAQLATGALVVPFLIAWAVWATNAIFALRPDQPRYSAIQAEVDRYKLKADILQTVANTQSPEWIKLHLEVQQIAKHLEQMEKKMHKH